MKKFLGLSVMLLAALSCTATAQKVTGTAPSAIDLTSSDPAANIMPAPNDVYANWKNAGLAVVGGIPTRNRQCGSTVNPTATSPTDATNINAAISACTPGRYVQLGAGATQVITASITNNTMTVTAGSGLAAGMVLFDTTGALMPGTTITAGSGNTWTVSYASYNGRSYTVPSESMTAVVAFQINQVSEYINLNKGVTLRGSGDYSSGGFWPTVINFYNGGIPDWTISPTAGNQQCGATSASASQCAVGNPMISMGASGSNNAGWAGIHTGTVTSTSGYGTTLAADVAQGVTKIQVASTANFKVGSWFLIEENPAFTTTANPIPGNPSIQASPDFLSSSSSPATNRVANPDSIGSPCPGSGCSGTPYAWSLWPNLVNQEIKLITAIGAGPCPGMNCTISFDSPLTIAFRQSAGHASQAYWPTACCSTTYMPFVTQAGVENLEITRGYNAIQVQFCAYCWIKNVEVAGFLSGAVSFRWAVRSEVTGSYLHHCFDCENIGVEYPLAVDAGSTETLVDNNIIRLGSKGMVGRATGGGNVVAYNYFGEESYQQQSIGNWWQDQYINGSHYAGPHHFLFEGNWGPNCGADETHGNTVYDTFFRNDCTALRPPFIDPSNTSLSVNDSTGTAHCGRIACGAGVANPPGPRFAAGPMAFDYWFAYVGNVLGTSGQTTTANGWVYQCNHGGTGHTNGGSKCIWMPGWTGSEWIGAGDPNLNLSARSGGYLFKSGNYDYVNASISDWASGYSQSLPNSLYTSTTPAFFSAGSLTYPWPWVTSQNAPYIQTNSGGGSGLPAKARWDAGTPFKQP